MEGNLHFKIDWASLILGRKFTIFLCFTLYLRAIFKYKPLEGAGGGLYLEGLKNGGYFAFTYEFGGGGGLHLEGLIHFRILLYLIIL